MIFYKKSVEIKINLLPNFTKEQICEELQFRRSLSAHLPANTLLNGLVNQKLSDMILDKAGIDRDLCGASISEAEITRIIELLQCITVKVTNYRDFEFAQVCTGGIPTTDIDWNTLESKIVPNIHFTGEILDVDGICGGYNLHFAWATGYIAGNLERFV